MAVIKNPVQWFPPSGNGFINLPGISDITDQNGKNITDQLASAITDTGEQYYPKYPTNWTQTG